MLTFVELRTLKFLTPFCPTYQKKILLYLKRGIINEGFLLLLEGKFLLLLERKLVNHVPEM